MKIIAIAGKGGVGKTTLASLFVAELIASGRRPVLAVDADPNSCLDGALGVEAGHSVGRLREEAREEAAKGAGGLSKREFMELQIAKSLVEAEDFDLIAMGRPEGPGCYCYANSLLRDILGEIAESYPYVLVDNEAGLENLSRRITPAVECLVLVADPSQRGLNTVIRLHGLAKEMGVKYKRLGLVINRVRKDSPMRLDELKAATGADVALCLPEDDELGDLAEAGRAIFELSPGNRVRSGVRELIEGLLG